LARVSEPRFSVFCKKKELLGRFYIPCVTLDPALGSLFLGLRLPDVVANAPAQRPPRAFLPKNYFLVDYLDQPSPTRPYPTAIERGRQGC